MNQNLNEIENILKGANAVLNAGGTTVLYNPLQGIFEAKLIGPAEIGADPYFTKSLEDAINVARLLPVLIQDVKHQILADVRERIVKVTVNSFEDLHDFLDANEYLDFGPILEEDLDFGKDQDRDFSILNLVVHAVDRWLKIPNVLLKETGQEEPR